MHLNCKRDDEGWGWEASLCVFVSRKHVWIWLVRKSTERSKMSGSNSMQNAFNAWEISIFKFEFSLFFICYQHTFIEGTFSKKSLHDLCINAILFQASKAPFIDGKGKYGFPMKQLLSSLDLKGLKRWDRKICRIIVIAGRLREFFFVTLK